MRVLVNNTLFDGVNKIYCRLDNIRIIADVVYVYTTVRTEDINAPVGLGSDTRGLRKEDTANIFEFGVSDKLVNFLGGNIRGVFLSLNENRGKRFAVNDEVARCGGPRGVGDFVRGEKSVENVGKFVFARFALIGGTVIANEEVR